MTTSRTPQTPSSSNEEPISAGDIAYYCERLRNRVFEDVVEAFAEEAAAGRITKAALARKLGKGPEQITRWFSGPSNWTLDTIGTLLLALEAELETNVVFLRDRPAVNYAHPLVEDLIGAAVRAKKREAAPHYPIGARPKEAGSDAGTTAKMLVKASHAPVL